MNAMPTVVPPQPRLTREQAEQMLMDTHRTSLEPDDGPYISFVWGFDPYPERHLPFFFRIDVSYQEHPPIFIEEVRSLTAVFVIVEHHFRTKEKRPMV
jgi:hypothetical protein